MSSGHERGKIARVCVYAGSRTGVRPSYMAAASALGHALAARGIVVVYGGGKTGLMGALADAVIDAGGEVIGVMPKWLVDKEIAHDRVVDFRGRLEVQVQSARPDGNLGVRVVSPRRQAR